MSKPAANLLPDGLAERYRLPPRVVGRLALLEEFDLSRITDNLIDKGPQYSPEQVWPLRIHFGKADHRLARVLEREFKRFIALTLMRPREIYAPSGPVDMYWHFFVLHTREYADFCRTIWGESISAGSLPDQIEQHYSKPSEGASHVALTDLVPETTLRNLSHKTIARLEALAAYDLSYFTEHLVDTGRLFAPEQKYPIIAHFGKCDIEVTRILEREFRRFVALTLIDPEAVFAPPGAVDMYWHFLILHTRDYRRFCDHIWGSYQHHPRGSRSADLTGEISGSPSSS